MTVYKCLHGLAPKYLAELCVPVADVAGRRQLRSASRGLLNFPRYNMSNYGRRAFCFGGPYLWNSLPEHIRQSISIAVFKRSLKTFLLQQISHPPNSILSFYWLYKCTDLLLLTIITWVNLFSSDQFGSCDVNTPIGIRTCMLYSTRVQCSLAYVL